MATAFHRGVNRFAAFLAAARAPGSTSLTLEAGAAAALGSPSAGSPVFLTAAKATAIDAYGRVTDPSGVTLFSVTDRSGDVLTAALAAGHPDLALAPGDKVYGFVMAEHLTELQAAVAALEDAGGGGGGVTSVGLTLPSGEFDVAGSPITAAGTLAGTWKAVAPNRVLAGPTNGASTAPGFRVLVAADMPDLSATYLARLGTTADETLARFDGLTGLLQGSGIVVTDANGISGYKATFNAQTGITYTVVAADTGKVLTFSNAAAIAVTLPNSAAVGTALTAYQIGAGQVTFSAQAGGFLRHRQSHTKIAGQWGVVSLVVVANVGGSAAEWVLAGDTSA